MLWLNLATKVRTIRPDSSAEEFLDRWATTQIENLHGPARDAFAALCHDGCHRVMLAAAVKFLEDPQGFVVAPYEVLFGSPSERAAQARTLETAATTVDVMFLHSVLSATVAVAREPGSTVGPGTIEVPEQLVGEIARGFQAAFTAVSLPSPGDLAAQLRSYARLLTLDVLLAKETETDLDDLSRFILAAYVERVANTARKHHRTVATLIAGVVRGAGGLTEEAHKQWWYRSHEHLRARWSLPVEILAALSAEIPRSS